MKEEKLNKILMHRNWGNEWVMHYRVGWLKERPQPKELIQHCLRHKSVLWSRSIHPSDGRSYIASYKVSSIFL